jgi:hypothetical protein
MAGYGLYNMLRAVSNDITTDNYVKGLPAHEVFIYLSHKKMSARISYKTDEAFQKIAAAEQKAKGK